MALETVPRPPEHHPATVVCPSVPAGIHAVCHCCGWRVAGGAGPHVLQYQTRWQVTPGESPVQDEVADSRPAACLF